MKKYILLFAIATANLTGCATIHEMTEPKNTAHSQNKNTTEQHSKLASQTSAWLGEPVTIASVDKGVFSTDFIAITRGGKRISCFYGGYFGLKMSSIVCGGRGNALLDAADAR